ncbi:MAG TPA: hypothetical protein VLV50_13740 [Stellaceae bacterium]|nr:hypothetical protein [Stellaceae bacterium]
MARTRILLTVAALLLLVGRAADAGDFVVIEADGIRLPAGQSVSGAQPLKLEDGQAVTLLSEGGETIHIDGPSTAAPNSLAKAGNGDVTSAMAAFITETRARTNEVGVVRGQNEVKLPDPWVVDVSHPGTSCVRQGQPVVLWRSAPLSPATIAFAPKDRSWNVTGSWPANADRVTLPATMPLKDNWDYVIEVAGRTAPVTVRLLPKSVNNDAMRAGYMREVGCGNQLNALLAAYQK